MSNPKTFLGLRTAIYYVEDLAAAKAWYAKVLGFEPYFAEPFYVGFNVGGFELGLHPNRPDVSRVDSAVVAYWGVNDARAVFQQLLAAGAKSHFEVQDVGEGILVGSVLDPFGNVFGIIQNPHFKAD